MKIKQGVIMAGIKLPMRKALKSANTIWQALGQELVVTAALDGEHSAGSLHYYGYAIDFRTRYFTDDEKYSAAVQLRKELGKGYDVVVHKTHMHVEYDAVK